MGNLNKTLASLLVLLMAFSSVGFLTVEPVNAQTQKPSTPKFTVKYADYSYYVPATYGIDAYTGQTKVVTSGYTRANRQFQFTIENEPFNQYDENSDQVQLYYYIRYKGHYQNTWDDEAQGYYPEYLAEHNGIEEDLLFTASDSAYTNAVLYDASFYGTDEERERVHMAYLPDAGKIDFQIQALIGKAELNSNGLTGTCLGFWFWTFSGQKSAWSETITMSIPDGSTTTTFNQDSTSQTQDPTPTPTVPELSTLMILPLLLSTLTVALIALKRKTFQTKP